MSASASEIIVSEDEIQILVDGEAAAHFVVQSDGIEGEISERRERQISKDGLIEIAQWLLERAKRIDEFEDGLKEGLRGLVGGRAKSVRSKEEANDDSARH